MFLRCEKDYSLKSDVVEMYNNFVGQSENVMAKIVSPALIKNYNEILPSEYKENGPTSMTAREIIKHVTPTHGYVYSEYRSKSGVLSIVGECSWDVEHGWGVLLGKGNKVLAVSQAMEVV